MSIGPDDDLDNASGHDTPTLGSLAAAHKRPESVTREADIRVAETKMLMHDYSQLPVMGGGRTVHGMVSWKSIGRAHVGGSSGTRVKDFMDDKVAVLSSDMSLLSAVQEIIAHEVVLVRSKTKEIVGIVTTTDLSERLQSLAAAFLHVGGIERQLRRIIGTRFPADVLQSVVAPGADRTVKSIADLSFGEYLRLIQPPERWERLKLKVDQALMLERLEEVRKVRNAVMHFRPGSQAGRDVARLRQTEEFLASLRPR